MDGWKYLVFFPLAAASLASPVSAQQIPPEQSESRVEAREAGEEPEMDLAEDEKDEIETDRDSFTPATTVAGWGRLVIESAYSFIDNDNVPETHSLPELLVRYGVNDWFEFRLGWNYEIGGVGSPISGNVPSDFDAESELEEESRLLYGFKAWLTEQQGWTPQSVVIVQGYTPTCGESTRTEMSVSYVAGWLLANGWSWDSGIRYSTAARLVDLGDGFFARDDFAVWAPSTVLKIPLNERWKAHVEYFGVCSAGRDEETVQHYFSPGVHYLLTSDLEVGVRVGWGLNNQAANFFANAGFGWRY